MIVDEIRKDRKAYSEECYSRTQSLKRAWGDTAYDSHIITDIFFYEDTKRISESHSKTCFFIPGSRN